MVDKLMQVAMRMEQRAAAAQQEADRIAAVRRSGSVPESVGPEIPVAPARGPVQAVEMQTHYPKGDGKFESKPAGFQGRKTLRVADVFDVMAVAAVRAKRPAPFETGQVAMGRFYRDLVEKHASAGVRCSSLEAQARASGGKGGEFIEAVLRDRQQIEVLRRRIGNGIALEVRKVRPSQRASRGLISDRRLVDAVCIEDMTLSAVLRSHGWARDGQRPNGGHIKALRMALRAALDRMAGPVQGGRIRAAQLNGGLPSPWD